MWAFVHVLGAIVNNVEYSSVEMMLQRADHVARGAAEKAAAFCKEKRNGRTG